MTPNNYFRVQGTLDVFTFDEGSPESVDAALKEAAALAHRNRTARFFPSVLVWRRFNHPQVRSMPAVGEVVVRTLN
jgi:hypothetical protein